MHCDEGWRECCPDEQADVVMSADSWTSCPSCTGAENNKRDLRRDELEAQLADAYGTLTLNEYEKLRGFVLEALAGLDKTRAADEPTFREDYEIYGAEEGTVQVSYSGRCEKCGLSVAFDLAKKFWPAEQTEEEEQTPS
jgi:hypothetical protein